MFREVSIVTTTNVRIIFRNVISYFFKQKLYSDVFSYKKKINLVVNQNYVKQIFCQNQTKRNNFVCNKKKKKTMFKML